jgi:hypothetical protein
LNASQDLITELGARTGIESGLGEEATLIADMVHRFAGDVMRPTGVKLDRMTPEESGAFNRRDLHCHHQRRSGDDQRTEGSLGFQRDHRRVCRALLCL